MCSSTGKRGVKMCFPALMLSYIRSASLQRKRDDDEVLRDVMRQVLPGAIRSGADQDV